MMDFLGTWKGVAAAIGATVALLGSGIGAAFTIDARYAHAGQVQDGLRTLEGGQLRSERRYLRDKINDLEAREALSAHDRRRLKELRDDLRDVEERIKEIKR